MNFTMIIIAVVLIGAIVGGGFLYISSETSRFRQTISAKDKEIEDHKVTITAQQIDIERLSTSNKSLQAVIKQRELELLQSKALLESLRKTDAAALLTVKPVIDFTANLGELEKANKYLECRNKHFPDIEQCLEFLK